MLRFVCFNTEHCQCAFCWRVYQSGNRAVVFIMTQLVLNHARIQHGKLKITADFMLTFIFLVQPDVGVVTAWARVNLKFC